jgi:hypothetical protein
VVRAAGAAGVVVRAGGGPGTTAAGAVSPAAGAVSPPDARSAAAAAVSLAAAAVERVCSATAPSPGTCATEAATSSAAPAAVVAIFCVGVSVAGAAVTPASPAPSWAASLSANWPSSLLPTSVMTPRPNWAGRPVMFRSVRTSTRVVSPSALSWAVMSAAAVPLPRWSLPRPSMTALCAASSFSTNEALPW